MKHRKIKPSPPIWFFYSEACSRCKHKNGCGNCKAAKQWVAEQKRKGQKNELFDTPHYGA